jgi:hypothetical protein
MQFPSSQTSKYLRLSLANTCNGDHRLLGSNSTSPLKKSTNAKQSAFSASASKLTYGRISNSVRTVILSFKKLLLPMQKIPMPSH